MSLYKLCEWEHNGHDDSDWYAVVYDSENNELRKELTGSTRFANALNIGPKMKEPTEEILKLAEKCLAEIIFNKLKQLEVIDVFEPNNVSPGDRVRLLSKCKNIVKTYDLCDKCNGSGMWINPKNKKDIRDCFTCNASGKINFKKVLKEDGKPVWEHFEKGLSGTVISCTAYGFFYRSGYKQPRRSNRRVIFKTDDGKEVKAPLEKLRRDREPLTDAELRAKSFDLAKHRNFYAPFRTSHTSLL